MADDSQTPGPRQRWLLRDRVGRVTGRRFRRTRRRRRAVGCLLWVLTLAIVLVVLGLLTGRWHQAVKVGGLASPTAITAPPW